MCQTLANCLKYFSKGSKKKKKKTPNLLSWNLHGRGEKEGEGKWQKT